MSNLPQVFTNRTVWFIFPTIVDNRFVNRFVNDPQQYLVGRGPLTTLWLRH